MRNEIKAASWKKDVGTQLTFKYLEKFWHCEQKSDRNVKSEISNITMQICVNVNIKMFANY